MATIMTTTKKELVTLGRNTAVDFVGYANGVSAKVDTGADSSSVWVSNLSVTPAGALEFTLFDESSPYYTGKVITRAQYKVTVVRSTTGHEQIRYRTVFSMRIAGKRIRVTLNLSDRSRNNFPVLIGRRSISGKFIVDVQQAEYTDARRVFSIENKCLNEELTINPYDFYKKYYQKDVN